MAIYAVGDLQGCLTPLKKLLDQVQFDPSKDQLWSTGDIVNRGPESLATMRYLHSLGNNFRMVLGNHDLHLLAVAHHSDNLKPKDTLQEILDAPDRDLLLNWLQSQPLVIYEHGYCLVHAGIPPQWDIETALKLSGEVEQVLQGDNVDTYFSAMYGNQPDLWSEAFQGPERWRVITNYLTRMRFCDTDGRLELTNKQTPANGPAGFKPWFRQPNRLAASIKILFGHWASLEGESIGDNLYPLDTGCVWGGKLRMIRLGDEEIFEADCNC